MKWESAVTVLPSGTCILQYNQSAGTPEVKQMKGLWVIVSQPQVWCPFGPVELGQASWLSLGDPLFLFGEGRVGSR